MKSWNRTAAHRFLPEVEQEELAPVETENHTYVTVSTMFDDGAHIENELPARAGQMPLLLPFGSTRIVPMILTPLVRDAGKPFTLTIIGSTAPPLEKFADAELPGAK